MLQFHDYVLLKISETLALTFLSFLFQLHPKFGNILFIVLCHMSTIISQ